MTIRISDCIRMKREGAEKIYEQIANMSSDEQLKFWKEKTELFRNRLSQRGYSQTEKPGVIVRHNCP